MKEFKGLTKQLIERTDNVDDLIYLFERIKGDFRYIYSETDSDIYDSLHRITKLENKWQQIIDKLSFLKVKPYSGDLKLNINSWSEMDDPLDGMDL